MPSSPSRQSQRQKKTVRKEKTQKRASQQRAPARQQSAASREARHSSNEASVNHSSMNQTPNGNAAVDAELVRLTSGAVISLLGLAEETGGVPNGMWRDPYALGFVYGTVCGLSVRVLASEDAELAPAMEAPMMEAPVAETQAQETRAEESAADTGTGEDEIIDSDAVEAAVARHDLAGVMSESFHDILQFSCIELSAAPSLEDDMLEDDEDNVADEENAADDNGAVVLARAADLMLAEQPDFLDGLRAADKVVALALGFPDYDADVDVMDARRRADAARIDLADVGINAAAIDGIPADIGTDDLRSGKMEIRGDDMIIDISRLIAGTDMDDDAEDAFDDEAGNGDLYLLSQDEAAVLYLQQRLFCREIRRRLSA